MGTCLNPEKEKENLNGPHWVGPSRAVFLMETARPSGKRPASEAANGKRGGRVTMIVTRPRPDWPPPGQWERRTSARHPAHSIAVSGARRNWRHTYTHSTVYCNPINSLSAISTIIVEIISEIGNWSNTCIGYMGSATGLKLRGPKPLLNLKVSRSLILIYKFIKLSKILIHAFKY